jgi:hypothetical protein
MLPRLHSLVMFGLYLFFEIFCGISNSNFSSLSYLLPPSDFGSDLWKQLVINDTTNSKKVFSSIYATWYLQQDRQLQSYFQIELTNDLEIESENIWKIWMKKLIGSNSVSGIRLVARYLCSCPPPNVRKSLNFTD